MRTKLHYEIAQTITVFRIVISRSIIFTIPYTYNAILCDNQILTIVFLYQFILMRKIIVKKLLNHNLNFLQK